MIDTEALRKKVIDLAIQGKLTEQLQSDGDARDLYEHIQEDKERLISEKKIKKGKKISIVEEDDIPFKIPENWVWVRLGAVCNEMLVPQRDKPKCFDGNIPWCRIEDIEGKYLNGTQSNQYVSQTTVDSMNLKVNPIGTVISACSASIGAAAICTVRCITNQTFIGLVCNAGLYNEYLYYYLKASVKSLKELGTGVTISYISQDKYREMLMPLPPLSEQKRIVEKIEIIFKQIDIIDDLQAKYSNDLAVLKSKIIDAGIQGKLTEQLPEDGDAEDLYAQILNQKSQLIKEGKIKKEKPLPDIAADEIPFEIPKNWKWVRLGELIRINSGTGLTSYQMGKGDIPVYGGNGVTGYHDESLVNEETIVIGRVGFYCGSVHVTPKKAWVTDNAFITQYPKNLINRDFLVYALKNMNLGQNTNGAAQPVVSGKKIYPLLFALPPYDEQKRIAKRIDDVLTIVDSLQ